MKFWIFINVLGICLFNLVGMDFFLALTGMLVLDALPFLTSVFYHHLWDRIFPPNDGKNFKSF